MDFSNVERFCLYRGDVFRRLVWMSPGYLKIRWAVFFLNGAQGMNTLGNGNKWSWKLIWLMFKLVCFLMYSGTCSGTWFFLAGGIGYSRGWGIDKFYIKFMEHFSLENHDTHISQQHWWINVPSGKDEIRLKWHSSCVGNLKAWDHDPCSTQILFKKKNTYEETKLFGK